MVFVTTPIENAIVIPNYSINGDLIGIRGRFLDPDAKAKYAPLWYNKQVLSHPTGRSFYGINENKENIQKRELQLSSKAKKA